MVTQILVNIGSGNDTKPLSEPMLTSHLKQGSRAFIKEKFYYSSAIVTILNNSLEFYSLKLLPHLPGGNELTHLSPVPHILYASVNRVCIGSDNDLSPIRHRANI